MLIYDDTVVAFIRKHENLLKALLQKAGFPVRRTRFEVGGFYYPIAVVVFEGKELGHFDSSYLQIGLNRKLIWQAKDAVVEEILKHELAHYITYIRYGAVPAHGAEFQKTCADLGFPKEIAAATVEIESRNRIAPLDPAADRVLEKVKKLLQLAQSTNTNEAELATLKANDLLIRHNLNKVSADDEPIYLDRVLQHPKKTAKLSAIYEILKHFIVRPVFSYGQSICSLEVSGTLTNVKLARYVAAFLDQELDKLWLQAKKDHALKGLRAKNSFFYGVASGFDHKMHSAQKAFSNADKKALIQIESNLSRRTHEIYKRLAQSSSGHRSDSGANQLGIIAGTKLSIRKAMEDSKSVHLLTGNH